MWYVKKPIVIEARQWTGDNLVALQAFTNGQFQAVDETDREDNPEHDAQVFDKLHSTWVSLKPSDWVIRGIQGEFYPCTNDVFEATYEAVEEEVPA